MIDYKETCEWNVLHNLAKILVVVIERILSAQSVSESKMAKEYGTYLERLWRICLRCMLI